MAGNSARLAQRFLFLPWPFIYIEIACVVSRCAGGKTGFMSGLSGMAVNAVLLKIHLNLVAIGTNKAMAVGIDT